MRPARPLRPAGPLALAVLAALSALLLPRASAAAKPGAGFTERVRAPFTGDFDAMAARGMIRILVIPSQTSYFVDKGTQRGLAYEGGQAFEEKLDKERRKGTPRIDVVFVPVHRDELLEALVQARGDLAAANLTITPERQELVDFSAPVATGVREIVVTGPSSPDVKSLDDLSGRKVFVRRTSSYFQSLRRLGEEFAKRGLPGVEIANAPEELEDEDILEMLNAGLIELAVVDDHLAAFWAKVLPDIRPQHEIAVRTGGEIAWAMRKNSPQLAARVNEFVRKHGLGSAFGNENFREYLKSLKYVKDAGATRERKKLLELIEIFRKYSDQYGFDWLMLAAQGYQESRLDQNVKSRVGAIGIMQVMPATGRELGVGDIRQAGPNIHAGTKYLRQMIDRNFSDPAIDPMNRTLFAFAGYNAGPARVARLRRKARKRGLDPDVWFGNVEQVAAQEVGQEPVRYVANIFKYYVAYKLVTEKRLEREAAEAAARKQ